MSASLPIEITYTSEIALDINFNAAILLICNRLMPGGFDVSDNAPET